MMNEIKKMIEDEHFHVREERVANWLKGDKKRKLKDFVALYKKTAYHVNGEYFHSIDGAGHFYGLTPQEIRECEVFIKRRFSKNQNLGFWMWVNSQRNARISRSILEQRVDEILMDNSLIYCPEKDVETIAQERGISLEEVLKYVNSNRPVLMGYAKKYNVKVQNLGLYRFDTYILPCKNFPNGAFVEIDGAQHFAPERNNVADFSYSMGKEDFLAGVIRDQIKNSIAEFFKVPILRISYYQAGSGKDAKERTKKMIAAFMKNKRHIPYRKYYKPLFENLKEKELEDKAFIKACMV